jgi:hypothetical protein
MVQTTSEVNLPLSQNSTTERLTEKTGRWESEAVKEQLRKKVKEQFRKKVKNWLRCGGLRFAVRIRNRE